MTRVTVKQYAAEWGVSTRTVRRWIEKEALPVERTPTGGIRIIKAAAASRVAVLSLTDADNCGQANK